MLEQFAYSPFSPLMWTLGFEIIRITILASIATKILSKWTKKSVSYRESLFAVIIFRLSSLFAFLSPLSLNLLNILFSLAVLMLVIYFWTKKYSLSLVKKVGLLVLILTVHFVLMLALFFLAMIWQSVFFDMEFYMNNMNDPNMVVIN